MTKSREYTIAEFSKLAKIGISSISAYKKANKLPKILTHQVLVDWRTKHQNPAADHIITEKEVYSRKELQQYYVKMGKSPTYVSTLIQRGQLPKKHKYTMEDIQKLSRMIKFRNKNVIDKNSSSIFYRRHG